MAIEREELPLPEDVNAEAVSPEEWQAEAETVEIVEAAEEEAAKDEITDEEPEAIGAGCRSGRRGGNGGFSGRRRAAGGRNRSGAGKPTKEGFFARLKRSLLKPKKISVPDLSACSAVKKIDDDLFEELEEQLLIADVGVETTRKIITI